MLERYWDSWRDFLQTRTGLKVQLNGEAPTALLSAMVKSRKAKTGIKELVRNGVSHTEAKEILAAATSHFVEVFGEQSVSDGTEPVLDWTPRRVLEEASAAAISRDWTEAEVKQAIQEMANGKSPGCDGIPKELFQHQWELLRKPVMAMIEEFVSSGNLPAVANEAVTILLYKKGEETDVRNYRPITLLTSVYKILAKVVASRMKAVLDQVISKEQFGFLPGRRLTDAVSLVADLIETAKNEDSDWYLLLIDFEKAYDSVRRGFMLETIAKLGFPPRFVGWIEALHRDVHMRLCINGWTGEKIQMRKGVRQGCPLAPYLFLCAVEPLSRLVEKRELGIVEKGCERLAYVGYADDTTLLLEGEAQLAAAGAVLQDFAAVSGLKVNTGKSAVLLLGKNVEKSVPAGLGYKWVEKETAERLLGVWITPGGNAEITWEKAFDRAAGELSKWQVKYLTTGARVTIINSYIIPIFLFQAQVYPPDELLWRRVEKLVENFVSANHADTEKHFRLWSGGLIYALRELGGLGVIDPRGRIDSVALRCAGLTLLQECSLRRGLAERAAGLPLGWATLYAHKAVLKGGLIRSRRWARICKAVLKSVAVEVKEVASRWEAAEEFLCFNRRIIHRGNAPFGGQKGTEKLRKWKMRDVVLRKWDGTLVLKSKEALERELGGGKEAEMALKAFAAAPEQKWLLSPLTADEVAAASSVVCTTLPGGQRCLWEVCACMGRKVELCGLDSNGERAAWKVKIVLGCDSVVPVVFSKSRAVREVRDARARLLVSSLFEGDEVALLKRLRGQGKALGMMQPTRHVDRLADLLFGKEETKSGFSKATMVAVAFHQIWLGRCDVSLQKTRRFLVRKVLRRINVEFNKHIRIYCSRPSKQARRDKARWNLAEDEARVMKRICDNGAIGLRWQDGFQSVWTNPRTFTKPP
ncbi:unnamed protein product [Closterium sp. Yama58-4]|nr:unnamed protein product [Closterium sp. Yama58-4]